MKLDFRGNMEELKQGIEALTADYGFQWADDGLPVQVFQHNESELRVRLDGGAATIAFNRPIHFFRCLGLLLEALRGGKDRVDIREAPQFEMNGPMFDVSQGNAVMTVDTVKKFLRMQAMMGLDMIMLYTEDSYDVKEQPYFGYMRGRYTREEIRELDRYAASFGIEMIPCIQTLSHLEDVLKWNAFADIRDDKETMLVGEEKTYEFIEQMIVAASEAVSTKRIHIGMDEAWDLGLGRYLNLNGYRTKFELMNEHLHRVLDITRKHGLIPMMWSDMYFRAGSVTGAYYDPECVIPPAVIEGMPKDVQFVYWDYYHYDEAFYTDWIRRHQSFGSIPIFAGGIWNWRGFVLNYGATFASTNTALQVCKKEGIREVIATLWGDDGTECDWDSALLGLQLYAEHGYAEELDERKLKDRFLFCTGCRYEDFMDIKWIDEIPGCPEGNLGTANPSRCLLWQNPLMGLFDRNFEGVPLASHYAGLADRMKQAAGRNGSFGGTFELLSRLCSVLELKAELGLQLTEAYRSGDRSHLRVLLDVTLPELTKRVNGLRRFHRQRWMQLNKPFGWEVIDFRYGGLLMSLDTASDRIADYLDGRLKRIEELEEKRLLHHGRQGLPDPQFFKSISTASRLIQ